MASSPPVSPRSAAAAHKRQQHTIAMEPPPTVTKGNRLAQFLFVAALSCVVYQLATGGDAQLRMKTSSDTTSSSSSSSIRFSSSECTCILACLGLFGLIHHKTKESAAAKRTTTTAHSDAQTLLYTQRRVRKQRNARHTPLEIAAKQQQQQRPPLSTIPLDVLYDLLLLLSPRDLSQLPLLNHEWRTLTGDAADALWRKVYARDFYEAGDRFHAVFPIASWRQFYFQHHDSRAVELARLLGQEGKQCVAIDRQVYDVTTFMHAHPGGVHVISDAVGTDATAIWEEFQHSRDAQASMHAFVVRDRVLEQPRRLEGNLAVPRARWERLSWCLTHAPSLGPMATPFADAMIALHVRSIRKARDAALAVAKRG